MTQKELAAKLNIAHSTMGSYVQNTREPDLATLKAIATFFHVSIDYLLDNPTGKTANHKEDELLRIFRSLEPGQQDICLEQCRVFVRANHKEKAPAQKTSRTLWTVEISLNTVDLCHLLLKDGTILSKQPFMQPLKWT